jgi:hypothetical protein
VCQLTQLASLSVTDHSTNDRLMLQLTQLRQLKDLDYRCPKYNGPGSVVGNNYTTKTGYKVIGQVSPQLRGLTYWMSGHAHRCCKVDWVCRTMGALFGLKHADFFWCPACWKVCVVSAGMHATPSPTSSIVSAAVAVQWKWIPICKGPVWRQVLQHFVNHGDPELAQQAAAALAE